jgi:hypothetical protein
MKAIHKASKSALYLIVTLIVLTNTCLRSQEASPDQNRKPVITFQASTRMSGMGETIWKLGFLNPDFVLYDDGLVIFRKDKNTSDFISVQLNSQEMKSLVEKFKIDTFLKLEKSYSTNNKFHQPINSIKYWQGSKMKKVSVQGQVQSDEKDRSKSPQAFLNIFDSIMSFEHKNSQIWKPYKLEISLYPQKNAKGDPIPWPREWPDLNHITTKKRTDDALSHSYKIYLDGTHKDEFELMLPKINKYQPVIINGKPWYLAPQRYILPNEEMWGN